MSATKFKITIPGIEAASELVAEIVPHESFERDWRDKYFEYKLGSIKEYKGIAPQVETMAISVWMKQENTKARTLKRKLCSQ